MRRLPWSSSTTPRNIYTVTDLHQFRKYLRRGENAFHAFHLVPPGTMYLTTASPETDSELFRLAGSFGEITRAHQGYVDKAV